MKPVDHVRPVVPGNRVRRVEERRQQKQQDRNHQHEQKPPAGQDPDGRTHIIDDLA